MLWQLRDGASTPGLLRGAAIQHHSLFKDQVCSAQRTLRSGSYLSLSVSSSASCDGRFDSRRSPKRAKCSQHVILGCLWACRGSSLWGLNGTLPVYTTVLSSKRVPVDCLQLNSALSRRDSMARDGKHCRHTDVLMANFRPEGTMLLVLTMLRAQ